MGKRKRTTAVAARKISRDEKQLGDAVQYNPFEIRVNKKKQDVLGQKMSRGERGMPGVSRSRAIEKRKKTLLKEYHNRGKTNKMVDHRFGEQDERMSVEEKMMKRFVMEKKRKLKGGTLFNLGSDDDEEGLTHFGHSLGDIKRFDDLQLTSDEEDYEGEANNTETHFGGFLHKKEHIDWTNEDISNEVRSRKEIMMEVVAKAKMHKYERMKQKGQAEELLEKLDTDWKDISSLLTNTGKVTEVKSTGADHYDIVVKELAREPNKARATSKLQSEEEVLKQKRVRFAELEKEQMRRMKGLENEEPVDERQMSADYIPEKAPHKKDDRVMLEYSDGKSLALNAAMSNCQTSAEEEEEEEEEEDSKAEGDDTVSSCSLVFEDSDDEVEEEEEEEEDGSLTHHNQCLSVAAQSSLDLTHGVVTTGEVPTTSEQLSMLLNCRSPEGCATLIDGLKTTVLSSNKRKQERLLKVLLEYILREEDKEEESTGALITARRLLTTNTIAACLYQLASSNQTYAARLFQQLLNDSFHCMSQKNKLYPKTSDLLLFKLIVFLYPMSDYKHCVTTPTLHLMCIIISKQCLHDLKSAVQGLFISQCLIESIVLSRRYIPELVQFLSNLISCFVPLDSETDGHKGTLLSTVIHSLRSSNWSHVDDNVETLSILQLISSEDFQSSDQSRVSILRLAVSMVEQLVDVWKDSPVFEYVFESIKSSLKSISLNHTLPHVVKESCDSILKSIHNYSSLPRPILRLLTPKPRPLKLFEPHYDPVYHIDRRKSYHKGSGDKPRLKHRIKQEWKGAIREIRKDNKFLSREKLKEQSAKDAERNRRVRQINSWLAEERHQAKVEKKRK